MKNEREREREREREMLRPQNFSKQILSDKLLLAIISKQKSRFKLELIATNT